MADKKKSERKPYIAIFDDSESRQATKMLWSLLGGYEVKLVSVNDIEGLMSVGADAVLILIQIKNYGDKNVEFASKLAQDTRVVADIIALAEEAGIEDRMRIQAYGFDGIYNISNMDYPDFRQVLLNRIEKGFTSLENRIQQEEYRRFKASLAASPDAFIVFDQNNKLFFVSEHYRNAYPKSGSRMVRGLDVMEAFAMCSAEEGVLEDDPRYPLMYKFWSTLEGQVEYQNDSGSIWLIKAKKLPDGQGTIVTTTDITHFKKQQQELEDKSVRLTESLRKEKEASAIQKQFVNMVSHEFRTPLSIIDGNAQILQRRGGELDAERIGKRAKTIRSAVSRLVNMMEGVLSSNMLKTGKLEAVPEPVDLGALIREICNEHRDLYASHTIKYQVDDLPSEIMLDRKLVILIINNLLSNAIKFSKENPQISVGGQKESDKVIIWFEDNGIGIPESEIDQVFNRYYRTTTASGIPGTGLGLNLVKELVALHGGTIDVTSRAGQGARFVVSFPIVKE